MSTVNKVMLLGNLTREPELRYTPKGTAVAELGMALNRVRSGDNGEKIEEVTYVDVTLWGRTAELAGQYLAKGRSVFIEGRLQMDSWDDKETGQKRTKLKIVGENMQFIGVKQDSPSGPPKERDRSHNQAPNNQNVNDSSDLPF